MQPLFKPWPRRRGLLLLAALTAAIAAVAASTTSVPPAQAAFPSLQVWLTTADGSTNLAQQSNITLGPVARGSINVAVDDSRSYQTMSGFGAAFTDSSAYVMAQLKASNQSLYNTMMNDLFNTSSGIGLTFWRIPMTSSDFTAASSPWTSGGRAQSGGGQPHFLRPGRRTSNSSGGLSHLHLEKNCATRFGTRA